MKKIFGLLFTLVVFSGYSQNGQPLVVVNGTPIKPGHEILDKIPVDRIESLTTYTSSDAVLRYGEFLGINGMIVIKTKFDVDKPLDIPIEMRLTYVDQKPVLVIDEKVNEYAAIDTLDINSVGSVTVINSGIDLVEKYGPRALNGVILVTTK